MFEQMKKKPKRNILFTREPHHSIYDKCMDPIWIPLDDEPDGGSVTRGIVGRMQRDSDERWRRR